MISELEYNARKAARLMSAAYNKFDTSNECVEACKKVFDGVSSDTYVGLWHAINDGLYHLHKEVRVLVAGGRDFQDFRRLSRILDKYLEQPRERLLDITIISGGAKGADKLGELYAKENGLNYEIYEADWDRYGKSAGYIRNEQMARALPTRAFLFWDGLSSGTEHMLNLTRKYKIKTKVIEY